MLHCDTNVMYELQIKQLCNSSCAAVRPQRLISRQLRDNLHRKAECGGQK